MRVAISYIYHNAFVVRTPEKTLLFDYPDDDFLQAGEQDCTADAVSDTDLLICVSHSHKDHFTPSVQDFARFAARTHYVLSYDIVELYPEFDPQESGRTDVTVIEPDEWSEIDGLRILGLESTDLGVGFLIQYGGKNIYYGGDVAEWDWEGSDQRARQFSRDHFGRTLETLCPYGIDLAFSNADERLRNWSGAVRFMREVHPRFFVPMHAFGRLEALQRFAAEAEVPADVTLLSYEKLGTFARIDL